MGRKGGWFHAVKRAITSYPQQKSIFKKTFSSENINLDSVPSHEVPPPLVTKKEAKKVEVDDEDERNKRAYAVALPTTKGKTKEEISAIKIQTAYRGYLARKSLRAMRGMARLKSFVEGKCAKRQAENTLRCMQTLARVQSQIHARRIRMSEENQALMRQLQLKHERENENMGETWDDSRRTKEQVETNLMNKQEAAMRRERALAYAFTQQRNYSPNGSTPTTFMDPNNPQWGWSWLERWMAARPWESKSDSLKGFRALSLAGEINRTNSLQDLSDNDIDDAVNKPSPSARRLSQPPTRVSVVGRAVSKKATKSTSFEEHDLKTGQPESQRRRSMGGGLLLKNDGNTTKSIKKMPSPGRNVELPRNGAMERRQKSLGYTKTRLSLSAGSSPSGPRRHSVGGKMETATAKDAESYS